MTSLTLYGAICSMIGAVTALTADRLMSAFRKVRARRRSGRPARLLDVLTGWSA